MSNSKVIKSECKCSLGANKYYLGSNGADGYRGETDEFNERLLDRLYIIKGGPGTGKSTFMMRCADAAELSGAKCTYYYCGSDPYSLDGVIVRSGDVSIGIMDGTSPHTAECAYPGAIGHIVDLGECLDSDLLYRRKKDVIELSDKKAAQFFSAYRYLKGAAALRCDITNMARLSTDHTKMLSAIGRIIKSFKAEGAAFTRCITGITMRGKITLDTFSKYENRYIIYDIYGCGRLFTENLAGELKKAGLEHISLREPINGDITAVALPNESVFFEVCDYEEQRNLNDNNGAAIINMQRFILKSEASIYRGQRRFAERCRKSLIEGAVEVLSQAAEYHFALEEIYSSAMDFDKVNLKCRKVSDEICSMI